MGTNISVSGVEIHPDIVKNMSRIIGPKLFKYDKISPKVIVNSYTHVVISFKDITDHNYAIPVCRINLFVDQYALTGSIAKGSVYIKAKGFMRDRWAVYRWLKDTIKEYKGSRNAK